MPSSKKQQQPASIFQATSAWLVNDELGISERSWETIDTLVPRENLGIRLVEPECAKNAKVGDALIFTECDSSAVSGLAVILSIGATVNGHLPLTVRIHEDWPYIRDDLDIEDLLKCRTADQAIAPIPPEDWAGLATKIATALYEYTGDELFIDLAEKLTVTSKSNNQDHSTSTIEDALKLAKMLSDRNPADISLKEYQAFESAIEAITELDKQTEMLEAAFGRYTRQLIAEPSNESQIRRSLSINSEKDLLAATFDLERDINNWILEATLKDKTSYFVVDPFLNRVLDWKWYPEVSLETLKFEALALENNRTDKIKALQDKLIDIEDKELYERWTKIRPEWEKDDSNRGWAIRNELRRRKKLPPLYPDE